MADNVAANAREASISYDLPQFGGASEFELLYEGAVNLFFDAAIYHEARSDLIRIGYNDLTIKFSTLDLFKAKISDGLKWNEQFGYDTWNGSMDALNDGFRGAPVFSASGRFMVCIEDFQLLVEEDEKMARHFLDILEHQGRNELVFGRRLLALIHTADYQYRPKSLGGRDPLNRYEWNYRGARAGRLRDYDDPDAPPLFSEAQKFIADDGN